MNMKGISLPVEMIVIVAIVVMVMVVLAGFFISGSGKQVNAISDDAAFGKGCVDLGTRFNCAVKTSKQDALAGVKISDYGNLLNACEKKFSASETSFYKSTF